ncbi:MAG: ACT domain-containing protein [Sedimentisphaerales bacterium]|nr:ACT domain-containing protein [Sedimentisphaerales bacterium]
MHIETQFSIFMVNKPGVLARVLNEFADAKINLIAITMMDSVEHGVMRLIGGSQEQIRKLLDRLNMQYSETDVLCVTLPNQAGALADVTQKLSKAHINISYAYATAGARGGKTTGVLKVADVKKAIKVLKGGNAKPSKTTKAVRRSPASRK